jgi:hypothetical protein
MPPDACRTGYQRSSSSGGDASAAHQGLLERARDERRGRFFHAAFDHDVHDRKINERSQLQEIRSVTAMK